MVPSLSPIRLFATLAVALAFFTGCHGGEEAKGAETSEIPQVQVAKPVVADIPISLQYTANVQAIFQERAVPEDVSGYLTSVDFENGQFVQKGQILASIDKSPYIQKLEEAREQLAEASAEVHNHELLVERYGMMLKSKLIAQQDFDNQETALEVAQAKLKHARDQQNLAKVYLDFCDIRAPFTGYTTDRLLDPGQYISPQGPPVALVQKIDTLRVFIDVIEHDIPLVKIGQEVEIQVDAFPTRVFPGTVTYIAQAVAPDTRTMRLEADIPNKDGGLRSGMYANVRVVVGHIKGAILVPDTALATSTRGAAVFPVKDGRMERAPVELGYDLGRFVQVTSGLDPSQDIVIAGRDLVKLGERVKPVPTALHFSLSKAISD